MDEFVGSKVAIFHEDRLVVFLRDDVPHIANPGQWDFFGGRREGEESPVECAMREIAEETGVALPADAFVWERPFESVNEPGETAYFFVANFSKEQVGRIRLTEGQRWELMDVGAFLAHPGAVAGMKAWLADYLERR